jgi:zinc-binding alcohol dehydrogenase family protein
VKAVGYREPLPIDRADALIDIELARPDPGPRDLLVAVRAVSVNPVDGKVRASARPPDGEARVLGFDASGIVEAAGADVKLFAPGDEVFYSGTLNRPGSNAEFQLVDERLVGRKPKSLSVAQAAALPLTSVTAWELLFDRLGVVFGSKGRTGALLIINGAGGVGSILTQFARRLTGLTVIATASRTETIDWCRKMGAHHVVDHRKPLDEELKAIGLAEVEYVASLTKTDHHLPAIVRSVAPQGKVAVIDDPVTLDIAPFKRKSVSVHWELMFTRSLFQTPDMAQQGRILNETAELVDAGVLRTTLTDELGPINAANLRRAHGLIESGHAFGKTVLSGFGSPGNTNV